MRKLLFLFSVLVAYSSLAQEENKKTPEIVIKMDVGETISLKDVSIKFVGITEDSRCPEQVTCIWAGRVIAEIEVTKMKEAPITKHIIIGQTRPNESNSRVIYSKEEYSIEVASIAPYPVAEKVNGPYVLYVREVN